MQLAQVRWVWRDRHSRVARSERAEVAKAMHFRGLPKHGRIDGSVWAVTMVRDELDVLPAVLDHLLSQGVEGIIVADNMSVDGTWEYLQSRAATEPRLHVGRDAMFAYLQARKMTYLSELARRAGADWVVPFDADEFWFAPSGRLAPWLASIDADWVAADWLDMVLLSEGTVDANSTFLMDASPAELRKVAFRSIPGVQLTIGNYKVLRAGVEASPRLKVAHARWRTASQVARKVRQGAEAMDAAGYDEYGRHWRAAANRGDEEIANAWSDLQAARPVPMLDWDAKGPMVQVGVVGWAEWNPEGLPELA